MIVVTIAETIAGNTSNVPSTAACLGDYEGGNNE